MVKEHTIKLSLKNDTPFLMTYINHWFDSGRVADHFSWPKVVKSKENHTVVCYEKNWAMSGCSGYVQYQMNGSNVTIAFSNPSVGNNKVGVGMAQNCKVIWENIQSHDYQQFNQSIVVGGVTVAVICACTGGSTNDATVQFYMQPVPCIATDNTFPSININTYHPQMPR